MKNIIQNPVYQAIIRNSSRPVCLVDRAGYILDINERFSSLTGYFAQPSSRSLFGSLIETIPEGFPVEFSSEEGERSMHFDSRLKSSDGPERWGEISVICIEDGKEFFLVFLRDISDRVRAERALEDKNKQLNFLTRYAHDLTAQMAGVNLPRFIVRQLIEFTGAVLVAYSEYDSEASVLRVKELEAESALLKTGMKIGGERIFHTEVPVSPENYESMLETMIFSTDSLREITFGVISKLLGRSFSLATGIKSYFGLSYVVEGKLLGTSLLGFSGNTVLPDKEHLLTFTHLSAVSLRRVKAEGDLFNSRERLRTIIDSFTDMIFVLDKHGRIEATNKFSAHFFKIPLPRMIGASFYEISRYNDEKKGMEILNEVFAAGEFRTMTHSQRGRDYRASFFPIIGQHGEVVASVVHIQDITERLILRNKLYQADKMQVVGELAGGVAHDFNNQLSGILGYTELLLEKIQDPVFLRYLRKIHESADNAAVLTKQLLSYARKGYREDIPVDIHTILKSLSENKIPGSSVEIDIQLDLGALRPYVKGDPSLLQNVFLNLLLNARDAMPEGGGVRIETKNRAAVNLAESAFKDFTCADCLEVNFSDEGPGIPRDIQGRIFDPFFTTKSEGQGTGMGLASAYGTIESHGGKILVSSKKGTGAVFSIFLPVVESPGLPE